MYFFPINLDLSLFWFYMLLTLVRNYMEKRERRNMNLNDIYDFF